MKQKRVFSFTLIEMLIVIVIIGILAAALVPRLADVQGRARNVQRKADIATLTNGIKIYYSDYGNYPRGLGHMVTGNIMTSLPKDPQMSQRHPCSWWPEGWWTGALADWYYFTSGFYNDSYNCGSAIENCSSAHYWYLYISCAANPTNCKFAGVWAMMENDGSINSYGGTVSTGAYYACNRGNNYAERWRYTPYGKYYARQLVMGEMAWGLNSKGKLFLRVFVNGDVRY